MNPGDTTPAFHAPINPGLMQVLDAEVKGGTDIASMRATYRINRDQVAVPSMSMHAVVDHRIDDASGLWVREYVPEHHDPDRGTLVYFHGGGWVNGGVDTHDSMCRYVAHHSRATVISVEYRLAPEHPFPAAVDDAQTALDWVLRHAPDLTGAPSKVGVGGDSAGGPLAIHAALSSPAELDYLVLLYPVTDLRMTTASYSSRGAGPGLTRAAMEFFARAYLNGHPVTDPRVSPLIAPELSRIPSTLVITAGHDPLHDEGLQFAAALAEAGRRVVSVDYPQMTHGFAAMGGAVPEGRNALRQVASFIADA